MKLVDLPNGELYFSLKWGMERLFGRDGGIFAHNLLLNRQLLFMVPWFMRRGVPLLC
jgi:hypothetical protein